MKHANDLPYDLGTLMDMRAFDIYPVLDECINVMYQIPATPAMGFDYPNRREVAADEKPGKYILPAPID